MSLCYLNHFLQLWARVAGFIFPQPVTTVGVPGEYLMLLSAGKHIGLVDSEKFTGTANSMIAKSLFAPCNVL